MTVDALRQHNQLEADEEAERGPVRAEPEAAPIGDALRDVHRRGALSFGLPALRAGTGDMVPEAAAWTGMDALRADQGMNHGVLAGAGVMVEGAVDTSLGHLRVVAR